MQFVANLRSRRAYAEAPVPLFCRHNRFTADCPICSKGTALDPGRGGRRRSPGTSTTRGRSERGRAAPAFSGPQVSAGPYEDSQGVRYLVRLERVPGGLRLGEWAGSELRRRAPVLVARDLSGLIAAAADVLPERDAATLAAAVGIELGDEDDGGVAGATAGSVDGAAGGAAAGSVDGSAAEPGVSRGRAGDFREELRVEPLAGGRLRIGRWMLRPGGDWELRDAAPMLPAARYAEALGDAAAKGALGARAAADR